MPPLSMMLADVGNPTAAHLAAFLGLHPRTVARWMERGHAPRPVCLALFWLTRWGRSQVDTQAANDAALAFALARAESEKATQLAAALDALRSAQAAPWVARRA